MLAVILTLASALGVSSETLEQAFGDNKGALTLIESSSGDRWQSDATACGLRVAPCSSFKIWNAAIGLETGILRDPDALFWKWDGKKRFLEAWSADQTLRSAMRVSCVPAFQQLAREIGQPRMQEWIDKIDYGNRDTSAGIDVFWLPDEGRQTILISVDEQAGLIAKLLSGQLPFSSETRATLRDILQVEQFPTGTLYGKTGTGKASDGSGIGWFVGWFESGQRTIAFACRLSGPQASGRAARAAVEKILPALGKSPD